MNEFVVSFRVHFKSILVIPGQWEFGYEEICALKHRKVSHRILSGTCDPMLERIIHPRGHFTKHNQSAEGAGGLGIIRGNKVGESE